jgi:hypothetical protein
MAAAVKKDAKKQNFQGFSSAVLMGWRNVDVKMPLRPRMSPFKSNSIAADVPE